MASIYLDHDVPTQIKRGLQEQGHDVVATRDLRSQRADDAEQLLSAAQMKRMLVTHNREDFELSHRAWLLWQVPRLLRHPPLCRSPRHQARPVHPGSLTLRIHSDILVL